jgi:hypothetical protein
MKIFEYARDGFFVAALLATYQLSASPRAYGERDPSFGLGGMSSLDVGTGDGGGGIAFQLWSYPPGGAAFRALT